MKSIYYLPVSIVFLWTTFFSIQVFAQDVPRQNLQDQYQLAIEKTSEKMVIDGEMNEAVWQDAQVAGDFWMSFPVDDRRVDVRQISAAVGRDQAAFDTRSDGLRPPPVSQVNFAVGSLSAINRRAQVDHRIEVGRT